MLKKIKQAHCICGVVNITPGYDDASKPYVSQYGDVKYC